MVILFVIFIILLYIGTRYWEKAEKEKEMEEFRKRRQEEEQKEEKAKKEFEDAVYPWIFDAMEIEKKDNNHYEDVKLYSNLAKSAKEEYAVNIEEYKQFKFSKKLLSDDEAAKKLKNEAYDIYSNNKDKSFKEKLLYYIDNKGLKDSEVYSKAEISRQVFNNIINVKGYLPKKTTVFRLILSLKLNIEEATELLELSKHTFSKYCYEDIYVKLAIENSFYDVKKIYKEITSMEKELSNAN